MKGFDMIGSEITLASAHVIHYPTNWESVVLA
jgi:hypothetical protein